MPLIDGGLTTVVSCLTAIAVVTALSGNVYPPYYKAIGRITKMITVGMNYHVIEGKQGDFEEKFAGVVDALKAAEGHTS